MSAAMILFIRYPKAPVPAKSMLISSPQVVTNKKQDLIVQFPSKKLVHAAKKSKKSIFEYFFHCEDIYMTKCPQLLRSSAISP